MSTLVFRGRRVLTHQLGPAVVVVRDGRISEILEYDGDGDLRVSGPRGADGPGDTMPSATLVDLADDEILLPGLVDTHVHVNEPGRTDWEGFASATRAAAAAGVTTVLDMPLNSIPPTLDRPALATKRASADGVVRVDTGFWGGVVPENLGRLADLHEAGVFGFKCFALDSGVPEFPPLSGTELEQAMREIADFDGLLLVHAEDADVIASCTRGPTRRYADFLASRPAEAENAAIRRVLRLAADIGTRVHVVHLSSGSAVELVAEAKRSGTRITTETCPHYLGVTAEMVADGQTLFKCCPPIRDAANRELLWEGLLDGVIDAVVSDHSPVTVDLKALDSGDFMAAWGGIASLQLGFPLVWSEAGTRDVDVVRVARWMSERPAAIAGLGNKGAIRVGADADLAVIAPDDSFVVDPERLQHKNKVSPYSGRELHGVVRQTWLRGRRVHPEADGPGPAGALLARGG